jgi:hypothetical protein
VTLTISQSPRPLAGMPCCVATACLRRGDSRSSPANSHGPDSSARPSIAPQKTGIVVAAKLRTDVVMLDGEVAAFCTTPIYIGFHVLQVGRRGSARPAALGAARVPGRPARRPHDGAPMSPLAGRLRDGLGGRGGARVRGHDRERPRSLYRSGSTRSWTKVKFVTTACCGRRHFANIFDGVLVGERVGNELHYRGRGVEFPGRLTCSRCSDAYRRAARRSRSTSRRRLKGSVSQRR